jgi:hypothetical protein
VLLAHRGCVVASVLSCLLLRWCCLLQCLLRMLQTAALRQLLVAIWRQQQQQHNV